MDIRELVEAKARAACEAKTALALTPTRLRNEAVLQMARGLEEKTRQILEANRADLERARAHGHPRAFLDRLTLTDGRIEEMAPARSERPRGRKRGRSGHCGHCRPEPSPVPE